MISSVEQGLIALGLTKRDAYKVAVATIARRVAFETFDQSPLPVSEELHMILKDGKYRKMLVKVGGIFHSFLTEGIDGYNWQTAIKQVLEENSTAFRDFIESAEDNPGDVVVDDALIDNVIGEVVGIFLIQDHDNVQASEESGIASVARSPMVTAFRDVLHDVIDRISVEKMFPDVHQHLTRAQLD